MSDSDSETATCSSCGHTGPRGDAPDGEVAVVWSEDAWMCKECQFKARSSSRSPRRGGKGSGGLGRSHY